MIDIKKEMRISFKAWCKKQDIKRDDLIFKILTGGNMKASEQQVGGDHYRQYKSSPYKFLLDNQIPHHKAAIIRRILRYDHGTGGGLKDLKKIKHEIDLIIEFEHWNMPDGEDGEFVRSI